MVVEEIMTKNPVTVESTATVREAVEKLYELDVRHVPVIEDGNLVGILSDRDMRAFEPRWSQLLENPVSNLMSSDVLSVEPETEVADLIDTMIEQKVGAVPVVDSTGELVGIVSYIDVLRAARDSL